MTKSQSANSPSALIRSVDLSFVEKKLDLSEALSIAHLKIPKIVKVPIEKVSSEKTEKAQLKVGIGDEVQTGQVLASFKNKIHPKIISPVTGKVKAVTQNPSLTYPSQNIRSLEIETGSEDKWVDLYQSIDGMDANELKNTQQTQLNPLQINQVIKHSEIIGMGGAGFPTHAKINPVRHFIINAVECEPFIYTDFALMKHNAKEIIGGVQVILDILGYAEPIKSIHFAIKAKNIHFMTEIAAEIDHFNSIQEQKANPSGVKIEINLVSNNYPSGGEKQIIEQVFADEISGLPIEKGYMCMNVATLAAVYQAVVNRKPCVERLITIYNKPKNKIKNCWIRMGTPLEEIILSEGLNPDDHFCIIGGAMMGFEVHETKAAVSRITNCIQIIPNGDAIAKENYDECIRCGFCADHCPVRLLPQQLYWLTKNDKEEELYEQNLFDCIECGICDYVCPSNIPLVHHFRFAKNDLRVKQQRKSFSEHSKDRFDYREYRLNRAKEERARKLEEKRKQVQENKSPNEATVQQKQQMIEEALAQVKENKSDSNDENKSN